MIITTFKTRIFKEGENLASFISIYLKKIPDNSVLAVTSKIVALSEGRVAGKTDVESKVRLIKKESEMALPTKYVWLTIKDGVVMASAGIDESNADGKLILLPENSFNTARDLRKVLRKKHRLKNLGVLITDSRTMPLRAGVTGVAVGYSGFKGIKDYRGTKDIFGRKFKFSRTNVADGLAASAVLAMGEGCERTPLALIQNAPIEFREQTNRRELRISLVDDMYRPFFEKISKKK